MYFELKLKYDSQSVVVIFSKISQEIYEINVHVVKCLNSVLHIKKFNLVYILLLWSRATVVSCISSIKTRCEEFWWCYRFDSYMSCGIWQRSEIYRNESVCSVSPSSSVHTWLNETKAWRNTVIIIIIEVKGGQFSHLPDTFNRHCNLGLSCPRTSIANEFMKPFTGRSGTTCLCHLAAGNWGLITGTCWALALTLTMNGSPVKGQVCSVWLQYTFRLCCGLICVCSSRRSLVWCKVTTKHLLFF